LTLKINIQEVRLLPTTRGFSTKHRPLVDYLPMSICLLDLKHVLAILEITDI